MSGIAGALGGAFGIGLQEMRANRQNNLTIGLQENQFQNQKELNKQGSELQYDLWNKTNYDAQVKHMKKAGINPGLLYGKSGAGGSTTGSQGGGSAGGGNANAPMDVGAVSGMGMMASQIALNLSKKENLDADSENQHMDNKVKKLFGQEADSLEDNNRINKAKAEGKILYGKWADVNGGYMYNNNNTKPENRGEHKVLDKFVIEHVEANLRKEENEVVKDKVKYELLNSILDSQLKEAKIELTKEQERKLWHDIWQGWSSQGLKGLDLIVKSKIGKLLGKKLGDPNKDPLSNQAKKSLGR